MGVKECYEMMQGDYESVLSRLRSEDRIRKYLGKFLEDTNYKTLCKALADREYETAFIAVHNLKGLSLNLSFTMLEQSASALCEALRGGNVPTEEELTVLTENVQADYESAAVAIKACENGD